MLEALDRCGNHGGNGRIIDGLLEGMLAIKASNNIDLHSNASEIEKQMPERVSRLVGDVSLAFVLLTRNYCTEMDLMIEFSHRITVGLGPHVDSTQVFPAVNLQ
jgi:hypothetical protein